METKGLIDEVKRNVNFLLAGSGLRREEGEQPVRRLLYHLLMTLSLHDRLSAEERAEVKKLHKRYKNLFASKVNLKEKKGEGGKEKIPPHPPIKEKAPQRIAKETSSCVGDANEISEAFREECLGFLGQYDQQLLTDFYNYWSEANPRTGKMRFQGKRYWDTRKRLERWVKNQYSSDIKAAALRLQKARGKQSEQQAREQATSQAQQSEAQERERANAELERRIEESKAGAVSREEWLAMKAAGAAGGQSPAPEGGEP